jgi:hypothetical protein
MTENNLSDSQIKAYLVMTNLKSKMKRRCNYAKAIQSRLLEKGVSYSINTIYQAIATKHYFSDVIANEFIKFATEQIESDKLLTVEIEQNIKKALEV